ncbi:MAG: thymidine phosphorylase, partial [Clostridia bacterium]|nr:thymidine phosphorylase [Clostridia bacterium]
LGHTGGTLDKLESIPGFRTEMTVADLITAVKSIGVAVAGQTGNLVPADKMLYALRDVTATVDSKPLIAGSIMSKKLAAGADALVLDVKAGDGAFLKSREEAFDLAQAMVEIGNGAGRETVAVVTNMDQPLGRAVGNALEVEEAILTLRGEGPPDLEELCLVLGGWMLCLAGKIPDPEEGKAVLKKLIENGAALRKFKEMIKNQYGDDAVTENLALLPHTTNKINVKATGEGYISRLRAEVIGVAAMTLGAGREKKDSIIDPAVGIILEKKAGDRISAGETIAVIHAREEAGADLIASVDEMIRSAYELHDKPVDKPTLVFGSVDMKGR